MIFYHYTPSNHIDEIRESQVIKTTESNLHIEIEHYGPDVVWLFKEPLGDSIPNMMKASRRIRGATLIIDKAQWEITVDLPQSEVIRADKFFKKHNAEWLLPYLEEAGGSKAKTWYVIQRPIPSEEWVGIKERNPQNRVIKDDGQVLRPKSIKVKKASVISNG
tara:strand:+ start:1700 stop:2188 length:489 start_codon:yes stop_codon:yes gene_type:complete